MDTEDQPKSNLDVAAAMHLAESFTKSWNTHNVEGLIGLFQPEGTLTNPVFSSPLSGAALRSYLEAQHKAYPDIKAEVVGEKLFGTTTICGRFHVTGTWTNPMTAGPRAGMEPTGKAFTLQRADFFEIKDGKIVAWTQYYDRMTLLTQMGIIPPK
jgi:predicted ester cyclase